MTHWINTLAAEPHFLADRLLLTWLLLSESACFKQLDCSQLHAIDPDCLIGLKRLV